MSLSAVVVCAWGDKGAAATDSTGKVVKHSNPWPGTLGLENESKCPIIIAS